MDWITQKNRIYAQDPSGRLLAEITFPNCSDGVVCLDHTFVDPSLRGQGVADRLMRAAVDWIQAQGWKAVATCSYAQGWLETHPDVATALRPVDA